MDTIIYLSDSDTKAHALYSSDCPRFYFFFISFVLVVLQCQAIYFALEIIGNHSCLEKRRWLCRRGEL